MLVSDLRFTLGGTGCIGVKQKRETLSYGTATEHSALVMSNANVLCGQEPRGFGTGRAYTVIDFRVRAC
ncbi:hypothetical protein RV134_260458 [Roseovarius sp. EC-HK134]|nr:hypothetical protein RV134_260458 [Roseovarius sp. EC-HK134]VVT11870.1 hypothetical protein RV420_290672 [Roseovarius sp. EC-SD190]